MELRTLKYFVTVAEELNITHAAEKLNMSQPPLSNQIRNLEEELDTVLFVRGKRNLSLTDSGKLLYRRAKEIISLSEKAGEEIMSMGKGMTGTISIGIIGGMAGDIASGRIAEFMQTYPNVHFRILSGNSDELIEKLRSGLISLAIIASPYDQQLLNSFVIGKGRLTALVKKEHSLGTDKKEGISILELADEALIVPRRKSNIESIYKWFRSINRIPKIVCETDSLANISALVKKGVGIGIVPENETLTDLDVVSKEILGFNCDAEYLFVWLKGHPLPILEETFIDFMKMIS